MTFTVTEEYKGVRIDEFISRSTDLSRTRAAKLIEDGAVTVSGVCVSKKHILKAGDTVELELPEPTPYEVEAEDIPLDILYEDADIIVINKPSGMVVHPAPGNYSGTLVNALLYHCRDELSGIGGVMRPGIVHRIDKDTSGLLVVAKNDKAHASLAKQIAEKTCKRTYFALLEGCVKEDSGRIVTDIGRHPTDRLKMAVLEDGRGKLAVTDFTVRARFGNEFTLCRFDLQTGRTHQIRVHAKHMGHPVAGDPVYGFKKQKLPANGQLLHAWQLELDHPANGERMRFNAYLPGDFAEILRKLCRRFGVAETEFSDILEK